MKNILVLLILAATFTSYTQSTFVQNIDVNGIQRSFRYYVPAIYSVDEAVPLVFNFHGYNSSAQEQEIYANFKPLADTANFIIVFPQGTIVNGSNGWNNFSSLNDLQEDLDFVDAMLDAIAMSHNVDQNRIYSTGMSNGGFMSYDLACYMSDRFAAIASVTGSMTPVHRNDCNAIHPTPILQIHGTSDAVVSINGGVSSINTLAIDELVSFWVNYNNCDPIAEYTMIPDIVELDNCTAEHYFYGGGSSGATVEYFKIIGGGHTWPSALPLGLLGNTNYDINACNEIWRFFSQYSLDNLPASVPILEEEIVLINIYPNPTANYINIEVSHLNGVLQLTDPTGKEVMRQTIDKFKTKVYIGKLSSGIYSYNYFNSEMNQYQTGKLIVEY